MSYSFQVVAASKAEAKEKIAAQFDQVIQGQAVHEMDRAQAEAAAAAFIDLLANPADGNSVIITMSGYLSWTDAAGGTKTFVGTNVSVAARIGPVA